LFSANGLDPERIFEAPGENLPFPDGTFDVVIPRMCLNTPPIKESVERSSACPEAGGILHMEMPNFLSYFEGTT